MRLRVALPNTATPRALVGVRAPRRPARFQRHAALARIHFGAVAAPVLLPEDRSGRVLRRAAIGPGRSINPADP